MVSREGLEPPKSEDDSFTGYDATNYALPTHILNYCKSLMEEETGFEPAVL